MDSSRLGKPASLICIAVTRYNFSCTALIERLILSAVYLN